MYDNNKKKQQLSPLFVFSILQYQYRTLCRADVFLFSIIADRAIYY